MTFLSPTFMFIFLPIALIGYAIVPKYRKTDALPAIGMVFFVCLNINKPLSLIPLTVLVFSVIAATGIYKKTKNRLVLEIFRSIVLLVAIAILVLRMFKPFSFVYSVGMVMCLMAAASLCTDILRGEGRVPSGLWDGAVYVTYFPIMQAGPFVKYGDFVKKQDHAGFGAESFTCGVWLLLCGFVKCISVGALLMQTYRVSVGTDTAGVGLAYWSIFVFMHSLAVYAFCSGFSDMGRGISYMLGIPLENDVGDPFRNSTPAEYLRRFFKSFSVFCKSCIGSVVDDGRSGFFGKLLITVFSSLFILLLLCKSPDSVAVLFPATVVAEYFVLFGKKNTKKRNIFVKILGCAVTFTVIGAAWWIARSDSLNQIISQLGQMLSNPVFYIDHEIKYRLSNSEIYIISTLGALLSAFGKKIMEREYKEETIAYTVMKSIVAAMLIMAFVFCIIFLLPRFPWVSNFAFGSFSL